MTVLLQRQKLPRPFSSKEMVITDSRSACRDWTCNPPVNSLVGDSKFNNFAAQITIHEYA